ncbi:hypothetical protein CSAL01_10500 [Colletotrichum salicis]|uniref:Uncharacterized protein n=1 Tax=Colletotrichum salicis TaxID=1209931 RepID=A0A135RNA5_9PEZI|nr:hypothetical protein CSAL01_10500 [Colletotrichum salicis]
MVLQVCCFACFKASNGTLKDTADKYLPVHPRKEGEASGSHGSHCYRELFPPHSQIHRRTFGPSHTFFGNNTVSLAPSLALPLDHFPTDHRQAGTQAAEPPTFDHHFLTETWAAKTLRMDGGPRELPDVPDPTEAATLRATHSAYTSLRPPPPP